MQNIDFLELATGGPFIIRVNGETVELVDPADLGFQAILLSLQQRHVPGTPNMAEWRRAAVFDRWAAHYDLPDFESARRLAYLIDHHRSALVYDLQTMAQVDLGVLWRTRRWRTLLDLIDHLPSHSWFSAAVASDEDHANMLAETIIARQAEGEKDASASGPSLTSWTPEVSYLKRIEDAVRYVAWATFAAQSGTKAAGKPPEPGPVPSTPLERALKRAEFERRMKAHKSLVARVLPHKSPKSDAVD